MLSGSFLSQIGISLSHLRVLVDNSNHYMYIYNIYTRQRVVNYVGIAPSGKLRCFEQGLVKLRVFRCSVSKLRGFEPALLDYLPIALRYRVAPVDNWFQGPSLIFNLGCKY